MKFYTIIAVPTFFTWVNRDVINRRQESHSKSAETRFLRVVKGYRIIGRLWNSHIREELNIISVENRVHENGRNQSDHIDRTNNTRLLHELDLEVKVWVSLGSVGYGNRHTLTPEVKKTCLLNMYWN